MSELCVHCEMQQSAHKQQPGLFGEKGACPVYGITGRLLDWHPTNRFTPRVVVKESTVAGTLAALEMILQHAPDSPATVQPAVEADDSDSVVASCNCLMKSPELQYHKRGCKYRLISERDTAQARVRELEAVLQAICKLGEQHYDPKHEYDRVGKMLATAHAALAGKGAR